MGNVPTEGTFANKPAWHRIGEVIDTDGSKGMTIEQVLEHKALNFEVRKVPIFGYADYRETKTGVLVPKGDRMEIQGRYGVQRTDTGLMLGTVGKTWQPVQNRAGFDLVDEVIRLASGGKSRAWIESAFELDGGRKVAILVHIDNEMQIAGEDYKQYLLFYNGHDGRTSVTAATTNVRAVCENTVNMALAETTRVVRVRHTKNATDKIVEAQRILGLRDQYTEKLARDAEFLVDQGMDDAEFDQFLRSLMPINDEDGEDADSPAATMIRDRRGDVQSTYRGADNLSPIRDTRWGAVQAVVEYADYQRKFKDDTSQLKAQFGFHAQALDLKDRALCIAKDPALVATGAAA